MARLTWHTPGTKTYKTGVDRGVLYVQEEGKYPKGVAWQGLSSISESPSGGEPNPIWADNTKYLNLMSIEEFEGSITAYYSPKEFDRCDGSADLVDGVTVGQQARLPFGFAFRSLIGNDTQGTDYGYKITLVYGASASPSDKEHETINDTPDAQELSWDFTTIPVPVVDDDGRELINPETGSPYRPTASIVIDSTQFVGARLPLLRAIEDILYGTATEEARLPLPGEVYELMGGGS